MESSADKVKTAMRPAIRLIRGYQRALGYDTIVASISLVTSYQQYRCQLIDPETVHALVFAIGFGELSTDIMGFRGQQNENYINYLNIVKLLAYLVLLTNTSILVRKYISRKTILTLHFKYKNFLEQYNVFRIYIKNQTYGDI